MAVERMRSKAAWANTFDIITHTNVHYTLRPANFVREHACGITIDRLGDLDQAIHTADYEKLKEAALAVAPKLWEGYYLSQAIDSACG